jgi:hypothetical protein
VTLAAQVPTSHSWTAFGLLGNWFGWLSKGLVAWAVIRLVSELRCAGPLPGEPEVRANTSNDMERVILIQIALALNCRHQANALIQRELGSAHPIGNEKCRGVPVSRR